MRTLQFVYWHGPFEQTTLGFSEGRIGRSLWCLAAEHRKPRHAPGDDAAQCNAVCQTISRGQAQLFDPASGFQSPEEGLDLPSQCISFELMDSVCMGRDRQVRDQLPEHRRPAFWRVELLGMNDLELLMPVFLLLPDWRANCHRSKPDRKHGLLPLALRIAEPNLMRTTGLDRCHHL